MIIFHIILNGIFIGNISNKRNFLIKNFISFTYNKFDFFNVKKILLNIFLIKKIIKNEFLKKKTFLFIGTKNFLRELIYKYARSLEQSFVCNKWIGGILTNPKIYKKMLNKSIFLKKKELMNFTKKEKNIFQKEEKKIEYLYGGLRNLKKKPDYIIITDIKKDKIAINEAKRLNLKIIAFVDSDDDIKGIKYMIPFNNNSIYCIKTVFKILFNDIC